MQTFREDLPQLRWQDVITCNDVDNSFNLFCTDFKTPYDIHFPLKQIKFNRNLHSINKFMTRGLLISRITKKNLLKTNLLNRSASSALNYKNYRNIYNRVLRASKKLYFKDLLNIFKANINYF